jgi:hypothetical protein
MANNQEKQQEENNTININFLSLSSHNSGVMYLFLCYAPIVVMSMKQKGYDNKPDLTSSFPVRLYLVPS